MKILFVTARFPYPPLKGDQVRAYHQIRLLSRSHQVTLVSFVDRADNAEALEHMRRFCARIVTVPRRQTAAALSLAAGAFSPLPFQTLLYQSPAMRRALAALLQPGAFDVAHIQLARMAPYLQHVRSLPRVIDLIDALSVNMERRYRRDRSPLRLAAYIEWRRLRRYEQTICRSFEAVTIVSAQDRAAVGAPANLLVNPNGVDLEQFPFVRVGREPQTIVFSGNMGYFPNIDAVCWFAEHVLPRVRTLAPATRFVIVGTNPHPRVAALAEADPAITVTGRVPRVQDYLERAALAVVPMQGGSGMQFKVIEAMASGAPVVVTPFALGGIAVNHGEHLLIGDTAEAFASHVVCLLHDDELQARLAAAARQLVVEQFSWERLVSDLERVYRQAGSAHPRGAAEPLQHHS